MGKDLQRKRLLQAVIEILRETREGKSVSMNSLAAKAGLSQQMVSYVERDMRNPTLETVLRMTDALDMDIVDLLTQAKNRSKAKKGK